MYTKAGPLQIMKVTRLRTIGLGAALYFGIKRIMRFKNAESNTDQVEDDPSLSDPEGSSSQDRTQNRGHCTNEAVQDPTMSRSDLEECIRCLVCLELPAIPLELGCGHTVCARCTDSIMEQSAQRLSVAQIVPKCPICRKRISRHVFDLAVNYPVSNLVDRIMAGEQKQAEHSAAKAQAELLLYERRNNGYPTGTIDPSTTTSRSPLPVESGAGHGFALVL